VHLNDLEAEGEGQHCCILRGLAAINPEGGTGNGYCIGRNIAAAFALLVDHHTGTSLEEISHLSTTLRKDLCNVVSLGNCKTHGGITQWKQAIRETNSATLIGYHIASAWQAERVPRYTRRLDVFPGALTIELHA
jgi:hypothetical protein